MKTSKASVAKFLAAGAAVALALPPALRAAEFEAAPEASFAQMAPNFGLGVAGVPAGLPSIEAAALPALTEPMTPYNSSGIAPWLDRHGLRGSLPAAAAAIPAAAPQAPAMTPENSAGTPAWLDRHHLRDVQSVAPGTSEMGSAAERAKSEKTATSKSKKDEAGAKKRALPRNAQGVDFDGARMTPENSSGMPAWLDRHRLR
ncbi:MAG: hypothetical protein KGL04_06295 [Elusimicrobia bacterium]|nr:hypothetical protein [Elusimicrobiota bacterium]MDE2313764.1 hypothetical protein [Elusimicrobiota bacterium]